MGKTAVFVLSILQQLDEDEPNNGAVKALVLAHTRELAFQISKEFARFSQYIEGVNTAFYYGGTPSKTDRNNLISAKANGTYPDIVAGTPGRILDLINSRTLNVNKLQHFVIDEADQMLESLQMRAVVQEIFKKTPRTKQVMMYSATMSAPTRATMKKFMQPDPVEIYVDSEEKLTLHGLQQYFVNLDENQKNRQLVNLLDALDFNQVIIFVNTVPRANALVGLLRECSFPALCLHSGLSQEDRVEIYKKFREFEARILVATDLMGRGVDIAKVNIVINYDMPLAADQYLHRVGRAGRFGTNGLAISFVNGAKQANTCLAEVQQRFAVEIAPLPDTIDTASYMEA
eukprot:TRINITY_DN61244_c0_g2_i2.p1 TRINITY_DN61244_c0_g2~~TRINITY_DN61244_c0_g2_i2.p1  ORF type:complete len:345 (-),score=56.95 TRINITY_DN61244_c0_g2_i2:939-1973(-)